MVVGASQVLQNKSDVFSGEALVQMGQPTLDQAGAVEPGPGRDW